jgi:predicted Fe-Mo cluster-binding NifX family protein
MKIAIPSDDKVKITQNFNNAKGFIVYELDNKLLVNFEYREKNHQSNQVINLIDDCSSVICNKIEVDIREELAKNDIKVLKTIESNAKKAVLNLFCST